MNGVPGACQRRSSGRENCGTTISLRPNKRESIENAPGPRRPREAAMTPTRTATPLISGGFKLSTGIDNSAAAMQHTAASTPPTGVKRPAIRDRPLATAIKAKAPVNHIEVSDRMRVDTPAKINRIPAVDRSSSRPMPGPPPGNVENNLCSRLSFAFSIVLTRSLQA